MRNHNFEHQDNEVRKYAYNFDTVIRKYLLRTLEPYFIRSGSVLELGCYKGEMTRQILGYFPSVTVVEAASDLADLVQDRFPGRVTVINSRFEDVRIEGRYDNIFLVHTLEHLDDRIGMLAHFRRWLSANGKLFVAVPNANALSRQIAVKMGLIDHNSAVTTAEAKHGHRCTYSMDVLLSELRRAGCNVQHYGGILLKPLANFQFDQALASGIVDESYLEACHELARTYPDLSATLYAVCT